MTAISLRFKSLLGLSLLTAALLVPRVGLANNSCKVVTVGDPSKGLHLVLGPDEVEGIFKTARRSFLEVMQDGEHFETVFESLAKGERPESRKKTLDELKDFRKLGIRLRSDFIVLDKDHEVPKKFEKFVKKLGHLNDALEFKAWDKVPSEAQEVLDAYRIGKIKDSLKSFKPATPKSVVREIKDLKVEIAGLVAKPHTTVLEFHETRKSLKNLLSIVQAINDENPTPEFTNAYEFLVSINDQLGDMRQDVLEDELKSTAAVDHDDDMQDLPDSVKASVKMFLSKLKADVAA